MSVFNLAAVRFPLPAIARPSRLTATLAVIALGYLMIVLDTTIVNVALPSIQIDLRFSRAGLAWVFNAYLLTFGGLLLLAGRAGDVFGRRRVFLSGVSLFTIASMLGGLAPSADLLIVMRVFQGAGAAMIAPNTMALLAANFPAGPARNRALSVYATVALTGGSLGLLLGGILTSFASWRWVMLVVVPVGIAIVVLAPRVIAETERRTGRFDVAGAITSTFGMASLVYGLIQAGSGGWTIEAWAELAIGGLLLAIFVVIEARAGQPIVPLRLFAERHRAGSYLNLSLLASAMFGTFFLLTQYLQVVRGFGPLAAGLAFLPQTGSALVAVRLAPRLIARFGTRPLMMGGAILAAIGMAALTRVSADSSYFPDIVLPIMLFGAGVGSSVMPLNVTILAGIAPDEAGAASGVAQAMQWVGGSLGIAILVTVFGAAMRDLGSASVGPAVAFSHGAASAFSVAVLIIVGALIVATFVIRRREQVAETSRAADCPGEPMRSPVEVPEMV
jgi:EmrB/QacA subfamily drug resistance transporter